MPFVADEFWLIIALRGATNRRNSGPRETAESHGRMENTARYGAAAPAIAKIDQSSKQLAVTSMIRSILQAATELIGPEPSLRGVSCLAPGRHSNLFVLRRRSTRRP